MQAVSYPHQPPGSCFICTSASGEVFVDTGYFFDPGVVTDHNGRKYLCHSCVQTAADTLGLFDEYIQKLNLMHEEANVSRIAAEEFEKASELVSLIRSRLSSPEPLIPVISGKKPTTKRGGEDD